MARSIPHAAHRRVSAPAAIFPAGLVHRKPVRHGGQDCQQRCASRCREPVPGVMGWANAATANAAMVMPNGANAVRCRHARRLITASAMRPWLSVSQTQLSRIENGRPVYDLDRLMQWAKMLRIPPELLWFALPDEGDDVKRRQFMVAGGATTLGFLSPAVTSHAANVSSPDSGPSPTWLNATSAS
jgi:transcriptional regulator with XRE-family HTH domain